METILVILTVLAVVVIAGTFYLVNRSTGRRGPDLEPPSRGGVLAPPRPAGEVVVEERPPATAPGGTGPSVLDREPVAEPEVLEPEVVEPEVVEPEVVEPEVVEPVRRPSFRDRLAKARATFAGFLGRSRIDEETWDELEEALIRADLGVGPAAELLDQLRARVKAEGLETGEQLVGALKAEMKAQLHVADRTLRLDDGRTNVWLFVGVNGVGKTTTIGKLGKRQVAEGHQVVMAAGDTFRAAAAEQLETWADRAGADIVRGAEGADPSAIIFDAIEAAAARGADLVLADTAGRLHTKTNLMEELRKVRRVADKDPGHVTEVLLVLDATTGQNGLVQARQFTEATEVTGVVLTKLDGSAKGGIVFAIHQELGIPVKLVGLGETADDLVDFDPDEFVEGLLAV
jgi:fused signal recognition particle receptor